MIFYALQDKLTAANARIAELEAENARYRIAIDAAKSISQRGMEAARRVAELERQLSANTSNANMFAAVTAADPTPTTRLLYVDLTKDDCFAEFDKPLGDKQVKAIFCPQYSGNDLYA